MKDLKFKINKHIGIKNISIGDIITLKCDSEGVPTHKFWFRRFKDSEIDNCISPHLEEIPKQKFTPKKEEV